MNESQKSQTRRSERSTVEYRNRNNRSSQYLKDELEFNSQPQDETGDQRVSQNLNLEGDTPFWE